MDILKIIAIFLIVGGALGLAYGGFTYTKATHTAEVGPLTISVDEKESVTLPLWASVGAVMIGGILLLSRKKIL